MKIFCQNCGNSLAEKVSICPKCGFENKIPGKKSKLIKSIILFLIISLIGSGLYFYKGKLSDFYKKIKIGKNGISIDVDMGNKLAFQKNFEKYIFDRYLYLESYEYALERDGVVEILGISESYKKRNSAASNIEKNNCFANKDAATCKKSFEVIKNIDNEIKGKVDEKESLGRFCGIKEGGQKKCEEYQKFHDVFWYTTSECVDCGNDIQKLFETSSSLLDKDKASALINLADMLRNYQDSYLKIMQLRSDSMYKEYAVNSIRDDERKVLAMTNEEIDKAIKSNDIWLSLFTSNRLKEKGMSLTKGNFAKEFREQAQQRFMEAGDLRVELRKEIEAINADITEINDYISILNGDMGMNLSYIDKL